MFACVCVFVCVCMCVCVCVYVCVCMCVRTAGIIFQSRMYNYQFVVLTRALNYTDIYVCVLFVIWNTTPLC